VCAGGKTTPSRDLTLGGMQVPWLELESTNPGVCPGGHVLQDMVQKETVLNDTKKKEKKCTKKRQVGRAK
jgi:hypothetical protein